MKLLIVGFAETGHMGGYLASAANQLGIDHFVMDAARAEAKSRIGQSFNWHLRGKRPGRLASFGGQVLDHCKKARYDLVLTTGRAPLEAWHLQRLRDLGAIVVNYSTDDPWNPRMRAPWFLSAISSYDRIFTARRANIDDFRRCGVRAVDYMPFGYDPEIHQPLPEDSQPGEPSDVLFVGGCDSDRMPLIEGLVDAGLKLALFGGYWDRHIKTRPFWRGIADQDTIRAASAASRICICLVRRANRDGAVMRSYEAAAIGGCILAEDTIDHRELFGCAARYFSTPAELLSQTKELMVDAQARSRFSLQLRQRMSSGRHTYAHRLAAMIRRSTKSDHLYPDLLPYEKILEDHIDENGRPQ